jgi:hypothetical protein
MGYGFVIGILLCLISTVQLNFLERSTQEAIQQLYWARLEVQASRSPCPVLKETSLCRWTIFAKDEGQWATCNQDQLPSGAFLPSQRWIKIRSVCRHLLGLPIFLADQAVFRR